MSIVSAQDCNWTGTWDIGASGPLVLQQSGDTVTGTYYPIEQGEVRGTVSGNKLIGTWTHRTANPIISGDCELEMSEYCTLTSRWRYATVGYSQEWRTDWFEVGKKIPAIDTAGSKDLSPIQAQFEWIGMDADKVGVYDNGNPNGNPDGHFELYLNLPASTEIESILVYSADSNGNPANGQFWDTAYNNYYMIGVFDHGTQLNMIHVPTLGTFSGPVQLDLYCEDSGWFKSGNWFGLEVTLGDGTKLKKLVSIGGNFETPSASPSRQLDEPTIDSKSSKSDGLLEGNSKSSGEDSSFTSGSEDQSPSQIDSDMAIFDSWNTGSVDNNPTCSPIFTISQPQKITYIDTYHWNYGQGTSSGGTISLQNGNSETFGPWAVTAESASGAANAWWKSHPDMVIPAGTYTIIDSEPETWSKNSESPCGFSKVEGYPANNASSANLPLAEMIQIRPTVIVGPYEETNATVTPEEGGSLHYGRIEVTAPPGAVDESTKIVVKKLTGDVPTGMDSTSTTPKATSLSEVYDLGPDGIEFKKPVLITLSYDESALPNGGNESGITAAYFNGDKWVPIRGLVDTEKNTVCFRAQKIPGELFTSIYVATALITTLVGVSIYAYETGAHQNAIDLYKGNIAINGSDPIVKGTANKYITPTDCKVQCYALRSHLLIGGQKVKLDDPNLGDLLAKNNIGLLTFVEENGIESVQRYPAEGSEAYKHANWQKPVDYLTKNDKVGDCTDITNAAVSIFRALGMPAKSVFGYTDAERKNAHAWGEVMIGGKMYLIDENGQLEGLEDAMKKMNLVRPKSDDKRNRMWDEIKTEEYTKEWYKHPSINMLHRYGLDEESGSIDEVDYTEDNWTWVEKANSYYSQRKWDKAINAFEEAIKLDPKNAVYWQSKGTALYNQGKYDEAVKAFEEAIKLDPKNEDYWQFKGWALNNQGKYDEAIKAYDEAIKLDPKPGEAWHDKGLAIKSLGRTTEANAAFAKAKEMGFKDPCECV